MKRGGKWLQMAQLRKCRPGPPSWLASLESMGEGEGGDSVLQLACVLPFFACGWRDKQRNPASQRQRDNPLGQTQSSVNMGPQCFISKEDTLLGFRVALRGGGKHSAPARGSFTTVAQLVGNITMSSLGPQNRPSRVWGGGSTITLSPISPCPCQCQLLLLPACAHRCSPFAC